MRRDGRRETHVSEKQKGIIFSLGLDSRISVESPSEFRFLAHAFFARDTGRMKRAGERFCLTGE
jgi:hypothetical protein